MPASGEFRSIGIVFAMELESRGLKGVLSRTRRAQSKHSAHLAWQLGMLRITVAISGVGRANAAAATEALIEAGARTIINSGFAAALDDKAVVGDVVVVNKVLRCEASCQPLECDRGLSSAIPPSGSLGYSVWQSDVITSDKMILDPEEKRSIYSSTGAAALDMECYAAAVTCECLGVPFMSIKGVSDTASEELPAELVELLAIRGAAGQLWFILMRPRIWGRLWRLRKNVMKASDNLGDALGMMLLRISGA